MATYSRTVDGRSEMSLTADAPVSIDRSQFATLVHVVDGVCDVDLAGTSYPSVGQAVFVVNKGESAAVRPKSPTSLVVSFELSDYVLSQAVDIDMVSFRCNSMLGTSQASYDELRATLRRLLDVVALDERRAAFLLKSVEYELFNELVAHFSVTTRQVDKGEARVRSIMLYLNAHYFEPLSLNEVAHHFHMDSAYLSKYFKKSLGVNFKDYLADVRLYYAERGLRESEFSIARVATESGFSNISSFIAAFKRVYGATPSEYRAAHAGRETARETGEKGALLERFRAVRAGRIRSVDKAELIDVDLDSPEGGAFEPRWAEVVNLGTLRALGADDLRRHVSLLAPMGFRRGRVWLALEECPGCAWAEEPRTNWEGVDGPLDFLVERGLAPWIDLTKGGQTLRSAACTPEAWEWALSEFLEHVANRYGTARVSEWRFEMSLDVFDGPEEEARYFELFGVARALTRELSPQTELGGACLKMELVQAGRMDGILSRLAGAGADFYSFMLYPYFMTVDRDQREAQRMTDPDWLGARLSELGGVLARVPARKVFVTEWSNTVSGRNAINDTLYKGAYVLKSVYEAWRRVGALGYWDASDWYAAGPHAGALLTGASGLLTRQDIGKPSATAFRMLSEMAGRELVALGASYAAVRGDDEGVSVLACNYVHPNQLYFLKNEAKVRPQDVASFFPKEGREFRIRLRGLEPGRYEIRTFFCNHENGSVFDLWAKMGFSGDLRPSDVEYLRHKVFTGMEKADVESADGTIDMTRTAEPNELFLVNLVKKRRIAKR